jgi:hypothetical protein
MRLRHLVLFLAAFPLSSFAQSAPSAPDLLHAGIDAMGGEAKLRALNALHFQASLIRSMVEESERPEGPYILENDQIDEWRDLAHNQWRQDVKMNVVMVPEMSGTTIVSDGAASSGSAGQFGPGSGQDLQDAAEALALSPERVLLTALASPDLRRLPDLTLQGVPHHEVEFTWQHTPIRVFLNADTHLPTAVEWVTAYPYQMFWSVWGDVTTRAYYSLWWLQDGFHYPLQEDIFRNGLPDLTKTITKIDFNPTLAADEFAIAPDSRTAFAARGTKTVDDRTPNFNGAAELVPGVLFIRGSWNTTLVKQDDGIVVLEAPISSGYSAKVLEYIHSKYPGTPIKAVVTTSDAWPHVAGVREYVAQKIPVYVLDRNISLIQRILQAPRSKYPDALARTNTKPQLRPVTAKTVIGTGANRLELYPLHGETTERQIMVYFPEHKLLYGSDSFQKMQDGKFFYPQTMYELKNAVDREHLPVDRYFMMHIPPSPWSEVLKTVQNAS